MASLDKNRGFTLIEFIIVIAIISILSLGTAISMGLFGYGNAKNATGRIGATLDSVRLENMTKKDKYYLVIYLKNNDYYLSVQTMKNGSWTLQSEEKLDLKKGTISFKNDDGINHAISSEPMEGARQRLEVTFSKDTGGTKNNTLGEIVKIINVDCNNTSYKIHLVEATGKYYID